MTIKKIAFLVSLTCILFVQEELLAFIPSVQLTFLLVILYGSLVGIKDGSIIVFVHTLLDNLIMGSFNIWTILPMFLGLEITLVIGYLLKNKNEFILAIGGAIACIIYSLCFFIINIFVYSIKPLEYLIADLPFTIGLIVCSVISILFLFKPLYKLCASAKDRFYETD